MSENNWPGQLFGMADVFTPMAVRVAATLRLADHVAAGVQTVDALAERTNTDSDALRRLLGHLVTVGVFTTDPGGRYELTGLGSQLRDDHPGRGRAWLDIEGAIGRADLAALGLLDTVRTGEAAYPAVFGSGFWEDIAASPTLSRSFDALMGFQSAEVAAGVVADYDWAPFSHVVDVGGGNGTLLAAILGSHQHLSGTLVDLPGPADAARKVFAEAGLVDRSRVAPGSFFDQLPVGADVYILCGVIHDWNDDRAVGILRRCAEAAGPTGTVLVVEALLDGTADSAAATAMDLRLLAYFGGRERTLEDLAALGAAAGLSVTTVRPSRSRSLVELRTAG
jgi:2,7-dihydroxy-5-methyl-1-naphthoate 7-O-methyltransferase